MSEPVVVAVMLAHGREAMVHRAVSAFETQTYPEARLLILDTGGDPLKGTPYGQLDATTVWMPDKHKASLGELRNIANWCAVDYFSAEVIVHLDSDDWSGPQRIAEQVELLQSSGADVVGYREMLFWKTAHDVARREMYADVAEVHSIETPHGREYMRRTRPFDVTVNLGGEAWLYSSPNPAYCLGTSLMYRRAAWELHPFLNVNIGEDCLWMLNFQSKRVRSVSSVFRYDNLAGAQRGDMEAAEAGHTDPRMIASIHGGNLSSAITPGVREWRRVSEFDAICAERMRL